MRSKRSYTRGFKSAATLLGGQIRKVGEGRGFAVSKLLTHWPDVVGEDVASMARPVNISYGKGGFGATLTLLIEGAYGPIVQSQSDRTREKVNAAYGYNAIARVRFTQTAATGFAEPQSSFNPAPKPAAPSPEIRRAAEHAAQDAENGDLRAAIERLATNVLNKTQQKKET